MVYLDAFCSKPYPSGATSFHQEAIYETHGEKYFYRDEFLGKAVRQAHDLRSWRRFSFDANSLPLQISYAETKHEKQL